MPLDQCGPASPVLSVLFEEPPKLESRLFKGDPELQKAVGGGETIVDGCPRRRNIALAVVVLHVLSIARCRRVARFSSLFAASSRHRSSTDTTLSGVVLPKRSK